MLRILANDFGPNHGFTLFEDVQNYKNDFTLTSWQKHYGDDGHSAFRRDMGTVLRGVDVFIGERFLFLHEFRDRDKIDLTAAEYIGVAKVACRTRYPSGVEEVWQNAAQAVGKTAFWGDSPEGNEKIKKLGLWQPNHKHAVDSLRHMLFYLTFTRQYTYFLEQLK